MKQRLLTTLAAGLLLCGCTTTSTTGTKTYDPVTTEKVKAAIEPIVSSVVRRVIANSPGHADEIANYARAVGIAFCSAVEAKAVGPEQLMAAVDLATAPLQAGVDPDIIDGKNALIAVYKVFYADRFKAELPADKWPYHVCDVICIAIDQGLKDSGRPGVK